MKKEINSKSRRKWIMGGLAAFASVALLTTGFAVWLVGTQKDKDASDVDVTVDTAQNNSITFSMTLSDHEIALEEAKNITGTIVNVKDKGDEEKHPLRISYSNFTIKYGKDYEFNFKSIKFTIDTAYNDQTNAVQYASNIVGTEGNKLTGDGYAREGSNFTYIDAPAAIPLPDKNTATESGSTKTLTVDGGDLDFAWGSFFDHKSPATFYNEKYKNETDENKLSKAADEATLEMAAMKEQFIASQEGENITWKKIRLVATLSTEEVSA